MSHTLSYGTDARSTGEGDSEMTRLYAAGLSAVAVVEDGRVELTLEGRGARCVAVDPEDPDTLYVGTSDEGLFRSADGGETWQDQRPGAQADCHSLAAHHADPGLLYEAGGGGFAQSRDFGDSWETADEGMALRYAWGLAADAEDPTLVYASAASGPGRAHGGGFSGAAIYRRRDGARWETVLTDLAAFPYTLSPDPEAPGTVYAGLGDGTILRGTDAGEDWEEFARAPSGLQALAAVAP